MDIRWAQPAPCSWPSWYILERTGGRYGLQTMCIGFGMGTATIIERV